MCFLIETKKSGNLGRVLIDIVLKLTLCPFVATLTQCKLTFKTDFSIKYAPLQDKINLHWYMPTFFLQNGIPAIISCTT